MKGREQVIGSPDIQGKPNGNRNHAMLEEFYVKEGLRFRNFVRRMVLGDPADIDDLAATTMERVVRSYPEVKGGESGLRALVYRVGINTIRNHIRDSKRHPTTIYINGDHELILADDPFSSPESHVERQEAIAELRKAIATLPSERQQVLSFSYVHRMSSKEIAEKMGKTKGAVRTLLSRTREQLRELMSDKR